MPSYAKLCIKWPVKRTAGAVGSRNLQETAREYCPWLRRSQWNPLRLRRGGCQNTNEYCVGYATADNPLGPWKKAYENPILKSNLEIGVSGPGHNSFAYSPDGTELFLIYHAHTFPEKPSGNRAVYIDRVHFIDGKMVVAGPTKSPQPYPGFKAE